MYKLGLNEKYFEILDTKKKRDKFLFIKDSVKPLTVISYAKLIDPSFLRLNKEIPGGRLSNIPFEVLVLDESHTFKNPKAKITKVVEAFNYMKTIKKRILASGTPYSKDYRDLFSQLLILDKGKRLGKNYYVFENKYFYDKNIARRNSNNYHPLMLIKDDMKPVLFSKIGDCFHKLTIKNINKETEKKVRKLKRIKIVELTPEQNDIQKELLLKSKIELEFVKKEIAEAKAIDKPKKIIQYYSKALSLMSCLRQLANGFIYEQLDPDNPDKKNRKVCYVPTKKLEVLDKILKLIPYHEKIMIWSVYHETYTMIEKVLNQNNIKYVKIVGSTPPGKRQELIKLYKYNPSYRVFLSHPKSGGVGLNLQEACWSIYYSKDYSLIDRIQSEGRNMRLDSYKYNKTLYEIDIQTNNTIETKINENVNKKKDLVKSFEKYLKEFEK